MHDYMRAQQDRFDHSPAYTAHEAEIQQLRQEIASQLDRPHRRKLLRLLDAASLQQEEASLASFTAGFRLAWGIIRELDIKGE